MARGPSRIDVAHRSLIVEHHPDRFATGSADEQRRAEARTAEINEAHLLLTDPDYAARNKRKFDRVRAAGLPVQPAPQRRDHPNAPSRVAGASGSADDRQAAATEFDVVEERLATPWVAPLRRRRFRRR